MRIGQFLEYKGFVGSIEFDATNKTYYGHLLDIGDLVCYQADNIIDLHKQYHLAVDDYIEFKKSNSNVKGYSVDGKIVFSNGILMEYE